MESFSWKDKDAQGNKITYRASHFGGWWQLESAPRVGRALRDEVEFEPAEFDEDIWVTLRDLLWRKYQRRRVSWGRIERIADIIAGKAQNQRRDKR